MVCSCGEKESDGNESRREKEERRLCRTSTPHKSGKKKIASWFILSEEITNLLHENVNTYDNTFV